MIERVHLQIVATLAETGTLARAAARLHLTPSALSHRMSALEDRLGVGLWERDGRRLRLLSWEAGRLEKRLCLVLRREDADLPWMRALSEALARELPAGSPPAPGPGG